MLQVFGVIYGPLGRSRVDRPGVGGTSQMKIEKGSHVQLNL